MNVHRINFSLTKKNQMHKKFFLLLFTAFCSAQAVMAQFHIGAKAGTNITKIDGQAFKDKFAYGYHLGGFMEIGLGNKLGLQPEVIFNQYTSSIDSSFRNVYRDILKNDQTKVKVNYLSIPVLLRYKLIGDFLTLHAGPQFSILMDKDRSFLENGGRAFSKGDFSLVGGAQIKVAMFRLSGRYMVGLNNINDIDDQEEWRNQGFQVSLGIAL